MIPWELLDTAAVPGGGELRLKRRGGEFSIMLGSNELMNSRLSGSEEALATLAAARLPEGMTRPRMLIGGLGMGFTLRAALAVLPENAEVTVAELVPAVIGWAKGPMAAVFAGSLDDPRVTLHEGDVAALIGTASRRFDAILLDVDNGPDGLTRAENDGLYSPAGLGATKRALGPGGVLAVWSSAPDPAFTRRLAQAGFAAEAVNARANGKRGGARHTIWLATAQGGQAGAKSVKTRPIT
ncbi:spermidine synthase [Ensifer soli]|uniref:spermidine synthase n=1 Tax=Ciceribacter sp. sgz301302 TaxID=3342379 RepID=UPI0035B96222